MIDKNDPRLTAYVLGELEKSDAAKIDAALASSAELRAVVGEIRQTTAALTEVFQSEPRMQLDDRRKLELMAAATNSDVRSSPPISANSTNRSSSNPIDPDRYSASPKPLSRWLAIGIAAGLMCVLVGGAVYFSNGFDQSMPSVAQSDKAGIENPPTSRSAGGMESASPPDLDDSGAAKDDQPIDENANGPLASKDQPKKAEVSGPSQSPTPPRVANFNRTEGDEAIVFGGSKDQKSKASPKALFDKGKQQTESLGGLAPPMDDDRFSPDSVANGMTADGGGGALAKRSTDSPALKPAMSPAGSELSQSPSVLADSGQPILMPENDLIKTALEIELAATQKLVDQSQLRGLNLKVVTAKKKIQPQVASDGKTQSTYLHSDIFALEISQTSAKQAVATLAKKIDPYEERRLTFNDLIGASSSHRQSMLANELLPSAPAKRQTSGLAQSRATQRHRENRLREQATQMLVFNLRGFMASGLAPDGEMDSAMAKSKHMMADAPQLARNMRQGSQAGAGFGGASGQPGMGFSGAIDNVPDNFVRDPNRDQKSDTSAAPKNRTAKQATRMVESRPMSADAKLQLLNLDYSPVVEQLKRSLKLRNQNLVRETAEQQD